MRLTSWVVWKKSQNMNQINNVFNAQIFIILCPSSPTIMYNYISYILNWCMKIHLFINLFMICSWFVYNLFTTCSWPVHELFINLFMTCLWLVYNLFTTFSWLVLDLFINLFMTCLWLVYNLFKTCLRLIYN